MFVALDKRDKELQLFLENNDHSRADSSKFKVSLSTKLINLIIKKKQMFLYFLFKQIVLNCLNHFAYQDAIFLSERLHSECKFVVVYFLTILKKKKGNKIDNMPRQRLFKL